MSPLPGRAVAGRPAPHPASVTPSARLRASTATTVPGATASAVIDAAIPTLPLPPPLPAAHVLDNPARMAVAFGIPPPLPSLVLGAHLAFSFLQSTG